LRDKPQKHSALEFMMVAENLTKYSHLVIHFVNIGFKERFPRRPQRILNTKTNMGLLRSSLPP
jgi:hypothetical protein